MKRDVYSSWIDGGQGREELVQGQEPVAIVPKEQEMSVGVHEGNQGSASIPNSETALTIASLVVRLHRDANQCTASFSGSLTDTTRITLDGLAELLTGEQSVVLDLSRIDAVDNHGADALEALIDTLRAVGSHLQIVHIPGAVNGYERTRYE